MKSPDLSIIIVNYNTREFLRDVLASIRSADIKHSSEVIVVDNGSDDDSVDFVKKNYQHVNVVALGQNRGFSAGNNAGIKLSRGKYLLLLNSDTLLHKNTVDTLIEYLAKHKEVGVLTCKVVLANGALDPACHRGFPTPWAALTYFVGLERLFPKSTVFGQYHQGYKDVDCVHEIDSPSGAFFLVKREVINRVGLLDEDYFMYGEDLDWAYRIKKAGWKIVYYPQISITHFKKQSGRAHSDKKIRDSTQVYFYQTMKLFYSKHYQQQYPLLLTLLVQSVLTIKIFSIKYFHF